MRKLFIVAVVVLCWCLSSRAQPPEEDARPSAAATPLGGGACCGEAAAKVPGQPCVLLHEVGPGESLYILSAYYYGDARGWRRIYDANRKQIKNPNKIMVGQVLRIKVEPCWSPRFDLQEFLRLERRRKEALKAEQVPKRIIKTREEVETKVTVTLEEEEEEEETEEREQGAPGGTTIQIEQPGG